MYLASGNDDGLGAGDFGDDYSELEFHRLYLETGPCTFETLNREMDEWIKEYP